MSIQESATDYWDKQSRASKYGHAFAAPILVVACSYVFWPETTEEKVASVAVYANEAIGDALGNNESSANTDSTSDCTPIEEVPLQNKIGAMIMVKSSDQELDNLAATMSGNQISNFVIVGDVHDTVGFNGQTIGFAAAINGLETQVDQSLDFGDTWFALDEEGGNVQRSDSLSGISALPSAQEQSETMTAAQVKDLYSKHGAVLTTLGVDIALAPVADVGRNDPIGSRSYGVDAGSVVPYVNAVSDGYASAGILSALKHFPGHGEASGDTHTTTAYTPDISVINQSSIPAFSDAMAHGSADFVMMAHVIVPGLTDGLPASLSPQAYNLVRTLPRGKDVIAMTDALDMTGALGGSTSSLPPQVEAAIESFQAGADMAIVDLPFVAGVQLAAAERSNDIAFIETVNQSATRIFTTKGMTVCE